MPYLEMNRFRLYSIGSAIPTTVPIEDEWIARAYAEPREPPPTTRIRGLLAGFPELGSGEDGAGDWLSAEVDLCSIFLMIEVILSAENSREQHNWVWVLVLVGYYMAMRWEGIGECVQLMIRLA